MSMGRALIRGAVALAALALFAMGPGVARAFPSAEKVWSAGGGPPFDFGITSSSSGFLLFSDLELATSYGEVLSLVNMGSFALEPDQPPPLTAEAETDGVIGGIDYTGGSGKIVASQEDGDLLEFTLSRITEEPISHILAEGDKLGPVAYDLNSGYSYVGDNTTPQIIAYNTVTGEAVALITLTVPGHSSFRITDALYVDENQEMYFSTDVGAVFYIFSGDTIATSINVAIAAGDELSALAKLPDASEIYVANYDSNSVTRISTSSYSVVGTAIDLTPNSSPTDIEITEVENPTATYAYVAGALGVSVINTATHEVLDLGSDPGTDHEPIPTSAEPYEIAVSSLEDGNVYVNFTTGTVGLITERPLAAVTAIAYSGGGSSMGRGESAAITFLSDTNATYEFKAGGDIYGSGTLLFDSTGSTSGSVTADTETTVSIPYDSNKDYLEEGEDDVWLFVTSAGLMGRRLTSLSVDTPPPDVVARSAGFGNGSVYVNFDRLTVADMASYNMYVDPDPDAVLTKADAQASVAQPSSGSSVTAETTGLTNGTLYYIAVEAVDQGGNKSDNRTATLPDGSRISAKSERTVGPVGFGEGCSLGGGKSGSASGILLLFFAVAFFIAMRARRARGVILLAAMGLILLSSAEAGAQAQKIIEEGEAPPGFSALEYKPAHWSFELKTGFWMPQSSALKSYFSPCCNMITRIQGGYMFQERYGVEMGAGFLYKSGNARGEDSGEISQDKFTYLMFPIELSFVWRADYFSWRYLIPYMKAGFDGVVYYETVAGDSVKGMKWGMHAAGGAMMNISAMTKRWGDSDSWVNELFMTFETQYQYINSFGSGQLDLSGPVFSVGLLCYF